MADGTRLTEPKLRRFTLGTSTSKTEEAATGGILLSHPSFPLLVSEQSF